MIMSAGLVRMATLGAATWTYCGIGTGTATVNVADTDVASVVGSRKALNQAVGSAFTAFFTVIFAKGDNNSGSNITEIALFDNSTAGNMLFRSVASTATWSAFAKASTQQATISVNLIFST